MEPERTLYYAKRTTSKDLVHPGGDGNRDALGHHHLSSHFLHSSCRAGNLMSASVLLRNGWSLSSFRAIHADSSAPPWRAPPFAEPTLSMLLPRDHPFPGFTGFSLGSDVLLILASSHQLHQSLKPYPHRSICDPQLCPDSFLSSSLDVDPAIQS